MLTFLNKLIFANDLSATWSLNLKTIWLGVKFHYLENILSSNSVSIFNLFLNNWETAVVTCEILIKKYWKKFRGLDVY